MSSLSRLRNAFPLVFCGGLLITTGVSQAQGGDSGRLPPPPLPIPTAGASPAPGNAAAAMGAVGSVSGAVPIQAEDLKVVPGAAEDKRRELLGRIMQAKSQGIGISTYMMAFDALEESARGGGSEESILKRVGSLNGSLDEQFKRSVILKTQRAAPPIAASASSAPYGNSGGPGGGSGGPPGNSDAASLIQKLQSKYGNQIPDSLKDKIPAGMGGANPSDLLKNPDIQDLLKQYKGK